LGVAIAGTQDFDDVMEVGPVDGVTLFDPLVENGNQADGRVSEGADSGIEVSSVRRGGGGAVAQKCCCSGEAPRRGE